MNSSLGLGKARAYDGSCVKRKTDILEMEQGFVFFVRLSRKGGDFKIDVVMKGSKEDCKKFTVEVAILDSVSGKSMFKAIFQPRLGGMFSFLIIVNAFFFLSSNDTGLNIYNK